MAMALDRLYAILRESTIQFRKGEAIEGTPEALAAVKAGKPIEEIPGGVVEIYDMPHESEARQGIIKVDLCFIVVGVLKEKAEAHKQELIEILSRYPRPDRLAGGPSYIEVAAEIGDQGAAFQLFALGKVLGLWSLITPETLGFNGQEAREMAGSGFIMISGYSHKEAA